MTHDEDARLAAWLGDAFDPAPIAALEKAFARARLTFQRPAWMVNLTGGTIAEGPASGLLRLTPVLAAVVLIGLLAGALIVGGVLPPPNPAPLPLVDISASPEASAQPKSGMLVFIRKGGSATDCGNVAGGCMDRLWIANADGTGAHELVPDLGGCQFKPVWSPDGTHLLFSRGELGTSPDPQCEGPWVEPTSISRLYLTDVSGSEPQRVEPGCDACTETSAAFSSDSRRLVFVRHEVTGKPAATTDVNVLATMDLATGLVVDLESTASLLRSDSCSFQALCATRAADLQWSPDGTQIVFTRWLDSCCPPPLTTPYATVFVVDADGQNLHRINPSGGMFPAWSPDGTRILFEGFTYKWDMIPDAPEIRWFADVYTIRPDGTDLRRLTSDQVSDQPDWSPDGRIWFTRSGYVDGNINTGGPAHYWIMDADGSHAAQLSSQPSGYPSWSHEASLFQPTP